MLRWMRHRQILLCEGSLPGVHVQIIRIDQCPIGVEEHRRSTRFSHMTLYPQRMPLTPRCVWIPPPSLSFICLPIDVRFPAMEAKDSVDVLVRRQSAQRCAGQGVERPSDERTLLGVEYIAGLAEAVSCPCQFCRHIALHHDQCRGTQLCVEVGDGIGGNHDRDVTHVGVECAVEDALLSDLACQD
jgi:hypothetical protein